MARYKSSFSVTELCVSFLMEVDPPPQVPDPNTMNKVHYQYGIVYVHTCVGNAYFGQIYSIE